MASPIESTSGLSLQLICGFILCLVVPKVQINSDDQFQNGQVQNLLLLITVNRTKVPCCCVDSYSVMILIIENSLSSNILCLSSTQDTVAFKNPYALQESNQIFIILVVTRYSE